MKQQVTGIQIPFRENTSIDLCRGIASRAKQRRLQFGWSRKMLAARAGISPWTLKAFEKTGNISLETLIKISIVLDSAEEFCHLFAATQLKPSTLDALEKMLPVKRQRGRTQL